MRSSTIKDNQRTLLALAAVLALLSVFWYPTLKSNFSGLDEFCTFICFSKADDFHELLSYFIKPHNQHFAPVFKIAFFAEYKMFGMNPSPYHAVSIGLFLASAALLWLFIKKETGDRVAAALCSLAYATNSVYYSVVSWVFAQQITLSFIFLELALLSLQGKDGRMPLLRAALFCLLASLCLNYGGAAWLFCAIYLYFRKHRGKHGAGHSPRTALKNYYLLLLSALITVLLYTIFHVDTSSEYGAVPLNPLLYIHGTVIFIGTSVVKSLGVHSLARAVVNIAGKDYQYLPFMLKLLSHLAFISAAALAAAYYSKLSSGGKRLSAASFLIAGLSTLAIIAARAAYYDFDIYELSGIGRYSYFPLAFVTIGAAPYVSALSGKRRALVLILMPVWVAVHIIGLKDGLAADQVHVKLLDKSMFIARESLDRPVDIDNDGNVYITNMRLRGSRPLEDFSMLPGGEVSNLDMLRLFLGPDDLLAETRESIMLLRNKQSLGPGDFRAITPGAEVSWEGGMLHISGDSQIALRLSPLEAGNGEHGEHVLAFKAKAGQKSNGLIFCMNQAQAGTEKFQLSEGLFFEAHQVNIPCKRHEDAVIFLPKGTYMLDDMRLHW